MLGKKFKILTITLLTLLSTATFAAVHTQYSSTVCSNTPYLFGCDKLTTNGAHSNTLGDSTVTVNLTFGALKATAYTATIEPGQTYLFGCQKLTADATETNTLQQVGCECDSTVTLTLTVQAPAPTPTSVTVAYTADIYDGETYLFGCQKLTVAGPYTETFQRVGGGDSIVNLTLNVNPVPVEDVTVAYTADIFDGETYLFGCQKLTAAGPYTETFQRVGGGDSIVNLTLNVNPVPVQKVTVEYNTEIEVGQTYLFGCQKYTYTETGLQTLKDSVPAVNGGDSIIIVHLTVSAGGAAQKDTVVGYTTSIYTGETYLFGCEKLTTAGVYKDTLQRENVIGDSIVVLTLNVVEPSVTVAYTANIYDGETYLFGCQKLTAAGPYTETFQRAAGGDSIVNLTLNVNPIPDVTVAYNATIKQGETYLFGCQKLTAAGPYTETFQRVGGGDSIVNLTLAVNNVTYGDTTASYCGPWTWYEHTCDATDDYVHTFIGANIYGGDSIVTLHFTLLNASIGIDTIASNCGPFVWYEHTCTTSGDYVHTYTNAVGCDSVVTMHFTLLSPDAVTAPAVTECDSFYWAAADTTIYTTGTYVHTFTNVAGCDSVVTLDVTINTSYNITATAVEDCDSYYWAAADTTITTSGNYVHKFQTIHGCDSVVTLPVTINTSYNITATGVEDCDSYYWAAADTTITTSGNYVHKFQTIHGCDSIVTLPVTINPSYNITATGVEDCDSYYWAAADTTITTSGNYVHKFQTIHGCDSIVTLPVTINPSYNITATGVEDCDSYYWAAADTTITTSGNYVHKFQTIHGCDSIVTLPVTINPSYNITATGVEDCDSYYWAAADTTITTSGNYVHKFQTIHGCDSVVTLPVTINPSYNITATGVEDCDSYYWVAADTTITTSGNYVHKFQTIHGCDSIVTLPVMIHKSAASTETPVEDCDSYYWASADTTITTSGSYKHKFQTIHGCDSIVTLDVTIYYKDSTILPPIDTCNMYRWKTPDIDTLITTTGLYQHMFQTIHGCDSLVKLDVTIRVPYLTTLDLIHKFGDRLLMINRNQINKIDGWQLDSLDVDHPEYVSWYKENPAGEDEFLTYGYSYSMPNGDPIPAGTYYAVVNIPGKGGNCGAIGTTEHYTVKGTSQAPELVPTLARPGEEITVLNLNPDAQTVIRIYSAEGIIQTTYTSVGSSVFRMPAADGHGFYLVEIVSEDEMKSTLRYIVK